MPSQHKHTHAYKIQLPQTFSIPHSYLLDWCGYLPGARCRLFAYGPADATAIPKPSSLASFKSSYCTVLLWLSWKRGHETGAVVVVTCTGFHQAVSTQLSRSMLTQNSKTLCGDPTWFIPADVTMVVPAWLLLC